MNTLEDKLAFVHIKSHKRQVLQRVTIYALLIMMLIPLGYGVYKLLMQWDYNNLKHYIEYDIMQGYDKLYDYTLSIQDDEIKNIKDLPSWEKEEKHIGSLLLLGSSWKNDAFKSKMPRYSEPSMSNIPFSITCIEKNKDGGYDIKQYEALGIVYKYPSPSKSSPIYSYLTQEEAPKNVYNEAFECVCKDLDEYKLSKGSNNDIISILTPSGYTANKAGYDKSHTTSLFHSIDGQLRTIEFPYGRSTYGYGANGMGNVKTDRYTTYYSYSDRYLQIQEHPYNQLGKIMIFCIGAIMALCFISLIICIPLIRNKLRLSGYIWITNDKSEAIVFYNYILGVPKIRLISNNKDNEFTYSISKDGSRILLSNGDIYTLKVIAVENAANCDNITSIELRKGENISTYYKL